MADTHMRSKWEQYYASDPRTAPWDSHAASSQLRSYLCGCPAHDRCAPPSPSPLQPCALGPESGSASLLRADAAADGQTTRGSEELSRNGEPDGLQGSGPARQHDTCVPRGSGGVGRGDSGDAGPRRLHVCGRCARFKPLARPPRSSGGRSRHPPSAARAVRVLELCCGTGASLAFMRGLGFSVVGVDLVEAACGLAAERLTLAAAMEGEGAPVVVESVEVVAEALRLCWGDDGDDDNAAYARPASIPNTELVLETVREAAASASGSGSQQPRCQPEDQKSHSLSPLPQSRSQVSISLAKGEAEPPSTSPSPRQPAWAGPGAWVARGDLFRAAWPRGAFDFAYDCQGLHAMPPALRPAYVAVLRHALRRGGLLLLLVGRAEQEEGGTEGTGPRLAAAAPPPVPPPAAKPAVVRGSGIGDESEGGACGGFGCAEGSGHDPRVDGGSSSVSSSSSRGPSLMSRGELRALFPSGEEEEKKGEGGEGQGEAHWDWCWCEPTHFDLTPAYTRMPEPPPAWRLLLRRR